jgi:hypothetical protein
MTWSIRQGGSNCSRSSRRGLLQITDYLRQSSSPPGFRQAPHTTGRLGQVMVPRHSGRGWLLPGGSIAGKFVLTKGPVLLADWLTQSRLSESQVPMPIDNG